MAENLLKFDDVVAGQGNMTRDQLAAEAQKSALPVTNIPKAPTVNTSTAEVPTVIDSSMLGNSNPVKVPTQPISQPVQTFNVADQILKATEVEDTQAQKTANNLSTEIYNMLPKLQGETAALAEAQNAAGVGQKKQELQSLNAAILQKQAELGQDDIKLVASMRAEETKDTLLPFAQSSQQKLAGDAAIMRALKTSEIGVLNAQVIAKQGDIALAMETAQQAVAVKYAPYKEAINIYQQQLSALEPILSREDKKQARAQELKTSLALKEIDRLQQQETRINELAIESAKYGATDEQLRRIQKARNYSEAIYNSAPFLGRKFEEELLQQSFQNEIALGELESKLAANKGLNGLNKDQISIAQGTRTSYLADPDVKGYIDVRDAYERVQAGANQKTAAGDLSMIFSYMKLLDPGSVVREGEFANAQNAAGIPDRIRNQYNKALNGERLSDVQRNDFLTTAETLYTPKLQKYQAAKGAYENELRTFGIDPEIVLRNLEPTKDLTEIVGPVFSQDPLLKKYPYVEAQAVLNQVPTITEGELVRVLKGKGYNIETNFNEKGSGSVILQKFSNKFPSGTYGDQCGTFAHKIVDFPSVGDLKAQKFASVDKYGVNKDEWVPKVGDVVITGEHPKFGHVAVVNTVLPDGRVQLTESNFNGDEKVTHSRVVNPRDKKVYGAIPGKLRV
jgi:hypothetical protein